MRLDKYICDMNIASRKDAKKIIKSKLISVNGITINDPGFQVNENNDVIKYGDKIIKYEKYVYYMLNKPSGVVSATEDNISKTVIDILKEENIKDLFPVGRLDKDTVGLLLITNDGEFCHKLTSPNHNITKKYYVGCDKEVTSAAVNMLETGILLKDDGLTKPAKVTIVNSNEIILEISEGKYHQVKRMLAATGNKVIYLKRISIGSLNLDENLKEGEYRRLTSEEISLFE